MKSYQATLDKVSGRFFLLGFISGRLKSIPIATLASKLNFISLGAYLIGYTTWSAAIFFYPNHPKLQYHWYGFSQFKYQYQASALLGSIATIACILVPTEVLLITWIFALSNIIWTIGEHHKNQFKTQALNNEPDYSKEQQRLYFRFALIVTTSSMLTAILLTGAALMPTAAFVMVPMSSIVGVVLLFPSLYYWGKSAFYQPTIIEETPAMTTSTYVDLSNRFPISNRADIQQPIPCKVNTYLPVLTSAESTADIAPPPIRQYYSL